jgi:Holliday junction resolvase RusA-like endonuclease
VIVLVPGVVPWARARVAKRGRRLQFFTARDQALQAARIKRAIKAEKAETIPAGVPVGVRVVFYVAGAITAKPDVDNCLKLVLDAMTRAGVYADDAQVISVVGEKVRAIDGVELTEIKIWPLPTEG